MEPFEIMTSESQERMLAIVEPEKLDDLLADLRQVGDQRVGDRHRHGHRPLPHPRPPRRRGARRHPGQLARRRRSALRPAAQQEPADRAERPGRPTARTPPAPDDVGADLLELLVDPTWVFRQYDHQLFLNTVEGPGRRRHRPAPQAPHHRAATPAAAWPSPATATTAGAPSIPVEGTALVVAEAVMNLACVGARPLGLVNCLNFGNPEHPEVMWQLSESIDGMGEACRAFGIPVVGGNVSLYNESGGRDIDPTPVVGLVGRGRPPRPATSRGAPRRRRHAPRARSRGPLAVRVAVGLGARATRRARRPSSTSTPTRRWPTSCASSSPRGSSSGVHDTADGLGVALAEMAVRSGKGFVVRAKGADHAWLFAESAEPGRGLRRQRARRRRRAGRRSRPACAPRPSGRVRRRPARRGGAPRRQRGRGHATPGAAACPTRWAPAPWR